jgi:hypothetical protein
MGRYSFHCKRLSLSITHRFAPAHFAVGTPVTRRPPHRSLRAELPHKAPTSGVDAQTLCLPYPFQRTWQVCRCDVGTISWQCPRFLASCPFRVVHIATLPDAVSGTWLVETNSLWSGCLAPRSPPTTAHRCLCSNVSQLLSACPTSRHRTSLSCSFRIHGADLEPSLKASGGISRLPCK